jgi:hypothetical protein
MGATAVALKSANLCRVSLFFSALRHVALFFSTLNVGPAALYCTAIQPCTAQLPTFSAKVSALKSAILRRLSPFISVLKTSIFSLGFPSSF